MYRKLVKCIKLKTPYKIKLVNGKSAIVEKAWRSPYQLIEIVILDGADRKPRLALFLDGEVQFIEGEVDREYHIKGHIKNFPKKDVRNIAILGGGDGKLAGYLKDIYPNAVIYVLELDPCMIHIFKSYYPHLNNNAFNSKRVKPIIGDAFKSLGKFSDNYFDILIVDLPDVISLERARLYSEDHIKLIAKKTKLGGHISFYTGGIHPSDIIYNAPECLQAIKIVPIKGFLGAIGYVVHFKKVAANC
jgi:predicted membrane-bound spermidine synthase